MRTMLFRRIFLFVVIFIVSAGAMTIPGYLVYQGNKRLVLDNLGKSAMDIASTISRFIQSDIEPYEALNSIEDYSLENYDEAYYQKMTGIFHEIKEETGALFIYTLKYGNENEFIYVLDAEDPSSENFSPLGSTEPVWEELILCYEQGTATFSAPDYDSTWNITMVTGLAPIIDPDTQEILGVVGVDYDYTFVQPILTRSLSVISTGATLFVLAISLLFFFLFESRNEALEIDYLTGLFSKRYFDRHLRISVMDARQHKQPLAVMMIDVDSFKSINDQFGHLEGDKILRITATILKNSIRRFDTCSRYGGDEFAIIFPDTTLDQARTVGERILENIHLFHESDEKTDSIQLALSMGISLWNENLSPEDLLNRADSAMYKSKIDKANKIHFYEEE